MRTHRLAEITRRPARCSPIMNSRKCLQSFAKPSAHEKMFCIKAEFCISAAKYDAARYATNLLDNCRKAISYVTM